MGADIAFAGKKIVYSMEPLARFSLFSYAFLLVCYFWNASHSSLVVRRSLRVIFRGNLSLCFYIGVVFVGLFIPILITLHFWANEVDIDPTVLSLRIICALIGDLMLRYVISKAGRYAPLIYSNIVQAKYPAR
jgi:formate-dependent nitrite reductase membrane component NrfD